VESANPWGAKIVANAGSAGFAINGDYIEINGIDLTNPGGHGFSAEGRHHIRCLGNHAHDCGNSGITCANGKGDYYLIEGNTCDHNARLDWYSGISVYEPSAMADDKSMANSYHIIIRNNRCYGNLTASGRHSDGNGIILDDWNRTQNAGPKYTLGALMENNLCYDNGGASLKVCWSDNVLLRNNTTYKNSTDSLNGGTYRGDIYLQSARGCTSVNNIAVGDPSINPHNSAGLDKGSPSGVTNANLWANNLLLGGLATGDGSTPTVLATLTSDPAFVQPGPAASADFHLQPASPAIGLGTKTFGVPPFDLDHLVRPTASAVDLGAYQSKRLSP